MRIRNLILTTVLAVTPALPQSLPVIVPAQHDAVRQYLVLSDAQLNALTELQRTRRAAEQAIYEQIRTRQTQINNLLEQGSQDSATVGRLMIEVNNLQKQLPQSGVPYRTSALNVLNDAQKAKLPQLTQALELQRTAGEAVSLNLIDYPKVPSPRILPVGLELPSVNVDSER